MSGKTFELGAGIRCDIQKLVDTRLLVQANSGGGKSWALRRILEQTHGHVQQLVIDPEGEFATLRERFDYVLAARQHGDTIADPRSAKLLAERLLELGVSAVLDIYELKAHERIKFVRSFLEALVDAPKRLWRPALIVVDEAHIFCPQNGEAESAGAVIDLATRGRKRGYCAVLATQRLSKLHKDAAAECNNKLIGRTGLDVDMKRAADELGMTKEGSQALRHLKAGEFFTFGPAISEAVVKVAVGGVTTSHPKAGARLAFTPPPPTAKITKLLPQLADLPAEAEARVKTLEDLQRENTTLKREVTTLKKSGSVEVKEKIVDRPVEVPILTAAHLNRVEVAVDRAIGLANELKAISAEVWNEAKTALEAARVANRSRSVSLPVNTRPAAVRTVRPLARPSRGHGEGSSLPSGEKLVLTAIAQYDDGVDRDQLSVLTGYKRSTRDAYIQRLGDRGLLQVDGGRVVATQEGVDALGSDFEPLPTGEALQEYWLGRLPEGERKILEVLLRSYPESIDRADLEAETGYKRSTRDAYLQRLHSRRLVKLEGRGTVRASEELYS